MDTYSSCPNYHVHANPRSHRTHTLLCEVMALLGDNAKVGCIALISDQFHINFNVYSAIWFRETSGIQGEY